MRHILPLFALLLVACTRDNYITFSGFAQGTTYTIVALNPPANLNEKIDATFDEIDLTFSIFNPASLVSRVNRNETDTVTPLFESCFALAKNVHARTEGFYDPTVKPLVDAWGFGPGEQQGASRTGNDPGAREPDIDSLVEYVGLDKIRIADSSVIKTDPRVQLDFSSIAKGLTVDKLAELLESEGVTDYMVEVGGEVRVKGVNEAGRSWRIGIDKPILSMKRELDTVAEPTPELPAIATSGNYRNQFTDSTGRTRVHTIDPLTGQPAVGDILSVSIASSECAVADAWATGLMASRTIENARRILTAAESAADDRASIEYYIIYSTPDHSQNTLRSPNFPLEK